MDLQTKAAAQVEKAKTKDVNNSTEQKIGIYNSKKKICGNHGIAPLSVMQ